MAARIGTRNTQGLHFVRFVTCLALGILSAAATEAQVVISQVYGAGGNTGATYNADYVELYNRSAAPVSLATYSIQHASEAGTSWTRANLTGNIAGYSYYLIRMSTTGVSGVPLPTPIDQVASPSISMNATAGKVALLMNQTTLPSRAAFRLDEYATLGIVDFVGYGFTGGTGLNSNGYEGGAPTPSPSTTLAAFRVNGGCTDTQFNAADFVVAAAAPRNSATAPSAPCTPTGACCADPIQYISAADCALALGTYQGDYSLVPEPGYAIPAVGSNALEDISGTGLPVILAGTDLTTVVNASLPFGFPFYNKFVGSIGIGVDGYIVFRPGDTTSTGLPPTLFPSTSTPNHYMAPIWFDLHTRTNGRVYTEFRTSPDRFIIQWDRVATTLSGATTPDEATFQIILYDDGTFEWRYDTFITTGTTPSNWTNGSGVRRAIENQSGTSATQVAIPNPITSLAGTSLLFTPAQLPPCGPPLNDACASPVVVAAAGTGPAGITSSNSTATLDGPATGCGVPVSRDVWYSFTPNTTASWDIFTCNNSSQDTVIEVWDSCGGTVLACNDDTVGCGNGTQSSLSINLAALTTYLIRVAANGAAAPGGAFNLVVRRTPAGNDICGANMASFTIPGSGGVVVGDLAAANFEGNADSSCMSSTSPGQKVDLFYYFTPSISCPWSFSTCSGSAAIDTIISIHSACPTPSVNNQLACTDQGCGSGNLTLLSNAALTAGTPYIVRVALFSATGTPGAFTLSVFPTPPANDTCAAATVLTVTGGGAVASADTACGATDDGLTPSCGATSRDIWYTFTTGASQAGQWRINTCGSAIDTVLTLYSGACGSLTELGCDDDATSGVCSGSQQSEIVATLAASTQYRVRVASKGVAAPGGPVTLNVVAELPPANDACGSAAALALSTAYTGGFSAFATNDGSSTCDAVGRDLWYTVTVATSAANQDLVVDTCTSAIDTVVTVYSGACGALTEIACNDDCGGAPCGGSSSCVRIPGVLAGTYRVRVSDKGLTGGAFNVRAFLSLSNDVCGGALPITCGSVLSGTNVGATAETPLPPACTPFSPVVSNLGVWYVLSGTGDTVTLDMCNTTGFDTRIYVYSGTCAALTCVTSGDDQSTCCAISGNRARVTFATSAGVDYYIMVSGFGSGTGAYVLSATCAPRPSNDDGAGATLVCNGAYSGTTIGATPDGQASCDVPSPGTFVPRLAQDVYYAYTAPDNGSVTIDTCAPGFDTILSVHSGFPATTANQLASQCNDNCGGAPCAGPGSCLTFTAVASTTYYIRVAGRNCANGIFTLNVNGPAVPAATVTDNGPLCEGATLNLTSAPAGGTYSWTGPNSFSSTLQNPTVSNVTVADSGLYTVNVTIGGCVFVGSTNVVVNPNPVATASNSGPVCELLALTLTGGPNGMSTYSWTGPNSFSSNLQNPVIASPTAADAGIYTLTVTDSNGCQGSATTTVVVNANPVAQASANPPIQCELVPLTLQGLPNGMSSYSWTGPNSFSSNLQNPTIPSPTVADAGLYTLTVTDSNGCTDSDSVNVTINAAPAASASSNSPVCELLALNLVGSPNGMSSYSWTGPNSFTSNLQSPSIPSVTAADAGVYTLTVTDSNGCQASASTTVVVNANPVATASSNSPVCELLALNLVGGPNGMASYSWTGPNSFVSNLQNPSIPSATAADAGLYTLTVVDSNGCQASASTTVVVNSAPSCTITASSPVPAGSSNTASVPNAGGGANYVWTVLNGTLDSGQGTPSINYTAGASGSVTLQVSITDGSGCTCSGSASVTITSVANPNNSLVLVPVDTCLNASDTQVAVELWMFNLQQNVTGFQAFLQFDDALLNYRGDLSSYTAAPFPQHIQGIATAQVGTGQLNLDGSDTLGGTGTIATSLLATLVFDIAAWPDCTTTSVGFRSFGPFTSELSLNGVPIVTALVTTPAIKRDLTGPVATTGSINACYPSAAAAEAAAIAATSFNDACSPPVAVSASSSGTCTAIVTVTGTDDCGNSTSVTYNTRIDSALPVVSCANVPARPADAGGCTALVTLAATAIDDCDGTVSVSYAADLNNNLGDGYEAPISNPFAFPVGVTNVRASASDSCGNVGTCDFTVTVDAENEVVLDIELPRVFVPTSRCIRLVPIPGSCSATDVNVTLSFIDHDSNALTAVRASGTVRIPCGSWTAMCAKDEQHTQWDTQALNVVGTQYIPAAAYALRGGDNDNDGDVDINDVTYFIATFGGPENAYNCSLAPYNLATHRGADYSNNGNVGAEDYTFLATAWLSTSSCACTIRPVKINHATAAAAPLRSEVLAVELPLNLAVRADLTLDGIIDYRDVEVIETRLGLSSELSSRMRSGALPLQDVLDDSAIGGAR